MDDNECIIVTRRQLETVPCPACHGVLVQDRTTAKTAMFRHGTCGYQGCDFKCGLAHFVSRFLNAKRPKYWSQWQSHFFANSICSKDNKHQVKLSLRSARCVKLSYRVYQTFQDRFWSKKRYVLDPVAILVSDFLTIQECLRFGQTSIENTNLWINPGSYVAQRMVRHRILPFFALQLHSELETKSLKELIRFWSEAQYPLVPEKFFSMSDHWHARMHYANNSASSCDCWKSVIGNKISCLVNQTLGPEYKFKDIIWLNNKQSCLRLLMAGSFWIDYLLFWDQRTMIPMPLANHKDKDSFATRIQDPTCLLEDIKKFYSNPLTQQHHLFLGPNPKNQEIKKRKNFLLSPPNKRQKTLGPFSVALNL
jgi:hypothetical protein